ncbi:pilus assembly FimT family protein [Marinicellulosiphila megalodicopiae]|uniref:pilus assembly FimT family protein n=1 Tax=Marinicellulosiphila megalodicopiae TaxID=2724896 RepID=UPI003BB0565B
MNQLQSNKGFSLVELMVIVAIMGILLAIAVTSSKSSFDINKLNEAEANFSQAISRAKAISIRNQHGGSGNQITAIVCFSSNTISVREATTVGGAFTAATCSSALNWSGTIDDGISVKHTKDLDQDFGGLCFNNRGRIVRIGDCSADALSEYNLFLFTLAGSDETLQGAIF